MRWEIKEKIGAGKTYKVAFGNTLQEIRPVNTLQEMPLNNIFRETNHRFPENPTGPHLKMRLEIKEKIGAGKTYKVACGNTLQEIRPVNILQEMPLNNIFGETKKRFPENPTGPHLKMRLEIKEKIGAGKTYRWPAATPCRKSDRSTPCTKCP